MTFRVETKPLYLQVRDLLVKRIYAGEWKSGEPLPNEYQLATSLNVSIGTVRKAMDELVREWIITRKQGRGTFVNDQTATNTALRDSNFWTLNGERIEGVVISCNVERGDISDEEATRLSSRNNNSVLRITRVRANDCRPFLLERCVLPAAIYSNMPDDMANYRIAELAPQNGLQLGSADETIALTKASVQDAQALALMIGEPLLEFDRVVRSTDGRALEWCNARFRSDGIKYHCVFSGRAGSRRLTYSQG